MIIDEKTSLILEGGGMRGVFTCGVLDNFMDRGIRFPFTIGVSAGACNGLSYMSGQRGRAKASNIDLMEKYHYVGLRYLFTQGCIMDFKLLFEEFPERIIPYDYPAYFSNPDRFVMVTTNCLTGEAEYFEEKSSPVEYARAQGFTNNVIVLTRNKGYRKSDKTNLFSSLFYRRYLHLQDAIMNRNAVYNRTIELIERLEDTGEALVIRPEKPIEVGRMEKNTARLTALYEEGYSLADKMLR